MASLRAPKQWALTKQEPSLPSKPGDKTSSTLFRWTQILQRFYSKIRRGFVRLLPRRCVVSKTTVKTFQQLLGAQLLRS